MAEHPLLQQSPYASPVALQIVQKRLSPKLHDSQFEDSSANFHSLRRSMSHPSTRRKSPILRQKHSFAPARHDGHAKKHSVHFAIRRHPLWVQRMYCIESLPTCDGRLALRAPLLRKGRRFFGSAFVSLQSCGACEAEAEVAGVERRGVVVTVRRGAVARAVVVAPAAKHTERPRHRPLRIRP